MKETPNEILFKQASPDKVMPIFYLWRAIWRLVFDERTCPINHRQEIEKDILKWNQIIQFQKRIRRDSYGETESDASPVGLKGNVIDELEYQVGMMCKTLVDNETGYWNYTKDTYRIHGIDYRKSDRCKQWYPEYQDKDAKKKAQAALKQAMKDNPQDYASEN